MNVMITNIKMIIIRNIVTGIVTSSDLCGRVEEVVGDTEEEERL